MYHGGCGGKRGRVWRGGRRCDRVIVVGEGEMDVKLCEWVGGGEHEMNSVVEWLRNSGGMGGH